jgi:uncharacterized membrane protein YsdA (DUF1294 family)
MDWHLYYWLWLAAASIITLVLFGFDKNRAKSGGWRVPEATLFFWILIGGFPGGWIGRSLFHHKTQKGIFVLVLVAGTLIHAGLVYWLFFHR